MRLPKNEFTTFQIIKALGIPRERLRQWMSWGFITPSIQQASGIGTKALFARRDVYGIALFEHLLNRGYRRSDAALFVRNFTHESVFDLSVRHIVFKQSPEGITISFTNKDSYELDLKTGDWDFVLIINFKAIKKDIDQKLSKLS